ncbi:MAG: nucleotide-binding protein [Nitrospirales bacterium]|nr:nucleotide-binding protein [Nitrospirales bacterium]
MITKRRVYISMPGDIWLTQKQNDIKWAIVAEVEKLGYEGQVFVGPSGGQGLPAGKGWSLAGSDAVMRRCVAAAIIGFPKWRFSINDHDFRLATEYCHHEGAVAYTYGLPLLTIVEQGLEPRLLFNPHAGLELITIPADADKSWLATKAFRGPFENWERKLQRRRDVFLGYCSSSSGTARNLKRFLEKDLGVTVLDWQTDFAPGRSILHQIEEAAARCSTGIFLFTGDDKVTDGAQTSKAVPRDNVVFEAGFFSHAKDKDRVLIIREEGTKMPADLGGDIYAPLSDKSDLSSVEPYVRRFIEDQL